MIRPRIKPEHLPYRISGHRIRIGGVSYGVAGEILDPDGSVWTLLQAMNGERTVRQIVDEVVSTHPRTAANDISTAIEALAGEGYVEDVGAADPADLTERDKQRHEKGRRYFRWVDLAPRTSSWHPQALLKNARVTVVGVGGTGGVAALALAASGVGRLRLVDRDTVELSNLNRQILYTEQDIGRPKVASAVARLRALNSDIDIDGVTRTIAGVADLTDLAADCDVLLMTADQPTDVRVWANRACLAAGTRWVDAGYHGPLVTVTAFAPGQGACYECTRLALRDRHRALGSRPEDSPDRSAAVGNAVGAASAGISGYLAAHLVLSLLTDAPPVSPGKIQAVNLMDLGAPFTVDDPRHADCPACGTR